MVLMISVSLSLKMPKFANQSVDMAPEKTIKSLQATMRQQDAANREKGTRTVFSQN